MYVLYIQIKEQNAAAATSDWKPPTHSGLTNSKRIDSLILEDSRNFRVVSAVTSKSALVDRVNSLHRVSLVHALHSNYAAPKAAPVAVAVAKVVAVPVAKVDTTTSADAADDSDDSEREVSDSESESSDYNSESEYFSDEDEDVIELDDTGLDEDAILARLMGSGTGMSANLLALLSGNSPSTSLNSAAAADASKSSEARRRDIVKQTAASNWVPPTTSGTTTCYSYNHTSHSVVFVLYGLTCMCIT
jgi:hypothetical protein